MSFCEQNDAMAPPTGKLRYKIFSTGNCVLQVELIQFALPSFCHVSVRKSEPRDGATNTECRSAPKSVYLPKYVNYN